MTQDVHISSKSRNNTRNNPLANKLICGDCHSVCGPYPWHSTTTNDIVWECHNKKRKRAKCRCDHIYDIELQQSVQWAFDRLMKKYPSVPDDCKQIYASVIGEDAEAVNAAIDQGGYSMDALSVGILLESITVTQKYNLVFRFIDGSTFIKRFGLITPKGKYGAYSRPERKQKIIALHEAGMKPVDIAAEVGGTVGAIRMVLRRHKDHLSHT